jgi:hypothetical protein
MPKIRSVSNNLLLQIPPPGHPDASAQSGFLFFRVLSRLKTQPDGGKHCVANYTSDRVVFHIEGKPDDVVALVSPVSSFRAFTPSILTNTPSCSSSVSLAAGKSDSLVLTFLNTSYQSYDSHRSRDSEGHLGGY